jgi:hypothetical protein
MPDKFDDLPTPRAASVPPRTAHQGLPIPELVAEVYRSARLRQRARLLEHLLRPVGPLGLVAIAAGAFGTILQRGGYRQLAVVPEDAARISPDHMRELAQYLEQAYPESLLQIAPILADNASGVAAGVAVTLLLALQAWRRRLKGD